CLIQIRIYYSYAGCSVLEFYLFSKKSSVAQSEPSASVLKTSERRFNRSMLQGKVRKLASSCIFSVRQIKWKSAPCSSLDKGEGRSAGSAVAVARERVRLYSRADTLSFVHG